MLDLLYEVNKLLSSIGVREHFIDAEWASTDPRFSDLSILLEEQKDITLVVTISVRRSDAETRVKEFIEMSQSYSNIQPCLVPGNPAYLSPHESCRNSIKLIEEYAKMIRRRYDGTMYVGCEKIEKVSARMAKLFKITLFHVYKKSKLEEYLLLSNGEFIAIYTPVVVDGLDDAVKSYIIRRLGVNRSDDNDLTEDVIGEYILPLTDDNTRVLRHLTRQQIMLVIYPFSSSVSEIRRTFRKIVRLVERQCS